MNTQNKDKLLLIEILLSMASGFFAVYLGVTNTGPVSTTPYIFVIMIMQILIFIAVYKNKTKSENEENDYQDINNNDDDKKTTLINTITSFYITTIAMPYSYYMMIVYLTLTSAKYNT